MCPPLTCSQLRDESHALLGCQRAALGHVGFLLAPSVPRFQDLLPLLPDFRQPALEIASPALLQTPLFQNFLATGMTTYFFKDPNTKRFKQTLIYFDTDTQ